MRGAERGGMVRRLVFGVAAVALAAAAIGQATARTFRAADTQDAGYPTVQALVEMGRLIEERTGGRHRIQVFAARQLGEEKETIEQTRAGAIDIDRVNVAPLASFIPKANVLVLPFLFRSTDHLHRVLDGPVGAEILKSFEAHGFVGLAYYDSGARSIYNRVRPVRSPDDLAGLRLRVQQSDLMIEAMRALGAVPVALPYGQVATGLATGLIDGAENNWPSYVTTGHYKSAGYYSLTEHSMSPEVVIMSRKAWDSLPPEDQAIFREAAAESGRSMRTQWRAWEEDARRRAEEGGSIILADIDKAPFEAAMREVYERALADAGMKALVDRIRATR